MLQQKRGAGVTGAVGSGKFCCACARGLEEFWGCSQVKGKCRYTSPSLKGFGVTLLQPSRIYKKDGERQFARASSARKGGNGFKLGEGLD